MLYTKTDIEQQIIKLGKMLPDKSKEELQQWLNLLRREIGYNSASGRCKFEFVVKKPEADNSG